jgi:DNA (cytosine-5)-methyltransferase 1
LFVPKYTFIDLFSGCGGFSLGLKRAGFQCLAAIDNDAAAVSTYARNFPKTELVLERDLQKFHPRKLAELLPPRTKVDLIVGGPPCQGFSVVRQVDGANHGRRLVDDPRRNLYKEFLRYVRHFQPRVFIMENVPGIKSAAGGQFFTQVQARARKLGYRVHWEEIDAWLFGVPQKRVRHLIIGTRSDLPVFSSQQFTRHTHQNPPNGRATKNAKSAELVGSQKRSVTLWEAIGDLPPLKVDDGAYQAKYDMDRRRRHISRYGTWYTRRVLETSRTKWLTSHVARPHSERDMRDFNRLREGEHSAEAIARGVHMEFPYNRVHFKDRYTKQHRNRLCSTILAHLSKDGLMFIHPTQNRSMTPREAARVQSFPDWFIFPQVQTDAFRLIGNAVPPLVGEAIGNALRRFIRYSKLLTRAPRSRGRVPKTVRQVMARVVPLMKATNIKKLSDGDFRKGWLSLSFIHGQLHPDAARENGEQIRPTKNGFQLPAPRPRGLVSPVYARSGWPVNVVPIAREAWRRLTEGRLSLQEYYCSSARMAGVRWARRAQGGHG